MTEFTTEREIELLRKIEALVVERHKLREALKGMVRIADFGAEDSAEYAIAKELLG